MKYAPSLMVLLLGLLCYLQARTVLTLGDDLAAARGAAQALVDDNCQLSEDLADANERLRILDQSLRVLQALQLESSKTNP